MPPEGALPPLLRDRPRTPVEATEEFKVGEYVAPRGEDLPEGSAQVTFTLIPNENGDLDIFVHAVGIYDEDGFNAFMEAADQSGVTPHF